MPSISLTAGTVSVLPDGDKSIMSSGFARLGGVGTWVVGMFAARGSLTDGGAGIDRRNVINCDTAEFPARLCRLIRAAGEIGD